MNREAAEGKRQTDKKGRIDREKKESGESASETV